MKDWEKIITPSDRQFYKLAGYGGEQTFGRNPALLVIDMILGFTGTKPMETVDAIKELDRAAEK